MQGLMMDSQLLISSVLRFAEANFPNSEIVSVTHDNPRYRYTYKDLFRRSRQLANALARLGVSGDNRVGTLAWNDHRHLELYYGVSCAGHVLHTINPRLFIEQLEFIINHAADKVLFIDPVFIGIVDELRSKLPAVEHVVVLSDREHMPAGRDDLLCYEDLLAAETSEYEWPELDETEASSLCYTSGTTGNPKGVLYSHRSTILHAYAAALPDVMGLSARECVLPLVPMFHVNAWGVPYSVLMTGGKLVLPGPGMADGEQLHSLINDEGVTYSLGVPTIWLALLNWLDESGLTLSSLNRICVGGAACPQLVIDTMNDRYDVTVHHGWGMTEMSPLGVYNSPKAGTMKLPDEEFAALQLRQGRGFFGVEMKIVDDAGKEMPWDGKAFGALKVRGAWVCNSYFGSDESALDEDGWFETGDVATIDADGYMLITDRSKDVIKSGGEWISSIELENTAVNHPGVREAAVIGMPHPKWSERPLLVVVKQPGADLNAAALLKWFDGKVASWWVPDAVEFVDELPHTATGKLNKLSLREQFAGYQWPSQ